MHGRIYDPVMAQFLTPDPLMPNPSGSGVNAFSYVENQPLDFTDPSGFDPVFSNAGTFVMDGLEQIGLERWSFTASASTAMTMPPLVVSPAQDMEYLTSAAAADAGADIASDVSAGVSYVGTAVSAGVSTYSLIRDLNKKNVQRKPTPQSHAARAPGSPMPSAGRSGPSMAQTRTEAAPSERYPFGSAVDGAANAQSAHEHQPGVDTVLNHVKTDDAHEFLDGVAHAAVEIGVAVVAPEEKVIEAIALVNRGIKAFRAARLARKAAEKAVEESGLFLRASKAGYRLHEQIPGKDTLLKRSSEELVQLRDMTRTSLQTREAEMSALGAKGGARCKDWRGAPSPADDRRDIAGQRCSVALSLKSIYSGLENGSGTTNN